MGSKLKHIPLRILGWNVYCLLHQRFYIVSGQILNREDGDLDCWGDTFVVRKTQRIVAKPVAVALSYGAAEH